MFDIGFWELLLIGLVALVVVGPQRLPGVAVFVGHWIGRLRRMARNMRDEITEELETEHLKNLVEEQNREIDELRRDVAAVRDETERSLDPDPAVEDGHEGAASGEADDGADDEARPSSEQNGTDSR